MIAPSVLGNGTALLLEPIDHTDTASVGFWFGSGSRFEGARERGFSHFVEHMAFKGTGSRSAFDIARDIDRVGGYLNAFTERENTCFYCTIPAKDLELALDVLCDIVLDARFPTEEFEKERIVIENEIGASRDDAEDLAADAYLSAVFGRHPVARKVAGTLSAVRSAKRDDVFSYYRKTLTPERLLIAVSGKFSEERVIDFLENRIRIANMDRAAIADVSKYTIDDREPVPTGERRRKRLPERGKAIPGFRKRAARHRPPRWHSVEKRKNGGFRQLQVITGTVIDEPFTTRLFYSSSVFNEAVGESISSRLFQNIREKYGYCYSIFSAPTFLSDSAFWTVYASTSPEYGDEMIARIREEIRTLAEGGLSQTEIADAKSRLEGELILGKEDIENRMKRLARQAFFNGEVLTVDESIDMVRSVGENDVGEFIRRNIRPERFSLLAFGSREGRRK